MLHMNKFGLREHYRGLSAILLRNGPGNIMFFGLRGPLRDTFPTGTSPAVTMLHDFVCGAMLGALISTVSFPINGASPSRRSVALFLDGSDRVWLVWTEQSRARGCRACTGSRS